MITRLILVIVISITHASKLNVPSVLLPYNHDTPSNFTLKIHDGGCYEWSSSKQQEVQLIKPGHGGCSDEVVVVAITRSPSKITAVILAKERDSNVTLRCDVIVDAISRLQIVTTTRELYAEEAPEEFEVRAYDSLGNEFSSVEGIVFVWELHTITDQATVVPAEMVLRFITFAESPYETPHAIAPLENEGKQGYMVLIEGVRTGLARLSVKMAHSAYSTLKRDEVDLMVVANILLEPQEAFILPKTSVKYSAFQLKRGLFHAIDIVDSHYYIQVAEKNIGYLEDDGLTVSGQMLGDTTVILQDMNMKAFETLKRPTANLHVVDPSYISITIAPHNNPSLIAGNHYIFLVHIYDKNNNKILPSDNIIVETFLDEDFIRKDFLSKNGTYIEGVPLKRGYTKISAKLTAIDLEDELVAISPHLKASLSLDIYDRIKVIPPVTLLPWDPVTKPVYKVNLTAENASGSVIWHTDDPSLVEVTSSGVCQTKGEGETTISASLSVNPHNTDDAKIFVKEVLEMGFVRDILEVEVNSLLPLKVDMTTHHDGENFYFSQCENLPFDLTLHDSYFKASNFKRTIDSRSCVYVDITSSVHSFTDITINYESSLGTLSDSVTIGSYRPLRPVSPDSGQTVLALGTSRVIIFEGGPLPWIKKPSAHYVSVVNELSDELKATLIQRKPNSQFPIDVFAVYVECISIGEYAISLSIGNEKSETLPNPVSVESKVDVICAVPDSLTLRPGLPFPEECPSLDRRVVVSTVGDSLPLLVDVKDKEGRIFDNASSLSVVWKLSDNSLGRFMVDEMGRDEMNDSPFYGYNVLHHIARSLSLHGSIGKFEVSASISGYVDSSYSHLFVPSLFDSLIISAVDRLLIKPSYLVLYNHVDNKAEFNIEGGSGYFEVKEEASFDVVFVDFVEETASFAVSPLKDGNTTVIIQDLCLDRPSTASVPIRVSSLGSLEASIPERVEVATSVEVQVTTKDSEGQSVPVHSSMNIVPHSSSEIIKVSFLRIDEDGRAIFLMEGLEVGDTSLHFSCQRGQEPLRSDSTPVQVFPSLTLHPERITVIVGSSFQVETHGGPYPDSNIEFELVNGTICEVNHAGIGEALMLGSASLSARALVQYRNGQKLQVLSKNSVSIEVIALSSIRIWAPLRYIEVGGTMPIYALGAGPRENPTSYATARPALIFHWSLSNEHTGNFSSVYSDNDIFESSENFGIGRFAALKPGTVTLNIKVSPGQTQPRHRFQIMDNSQLLDSIDIQVYEPLRLVNPSSDDARILLSPNSFTRIRTNRDSSSVITYAVSECPKGRFSLIQVSSDGLISAGAELGATTVSVTVKEKFGATQSLSILVEVKPVVYLEARISRFMGTADGAGYFSSVPVGATFAMNFAFHDDRGRIFTSTDSSLDFRSSRFDLIRVARIASSNNTFKVNARVPGVTILHVWDKNNPTVNDYVKVESAPAINPVEISVPVGSFICFSTVLRGAVGERGSWKSQSSILAIDQGSGVGAAYQQGKAAVTYEISKEVVATSEVHVGPIKSIRVDSVKTPISNIINENGFFVPVTIGGDSKHIDTPPCYPDTPPSPLVPFQCHVSFDFASSPTTFAVSEWLSVVPTYVPGEGFGCLIRSLMESNAAFAVSTPRLLMEVVASSSSVMDAARSNVTELPFYPAVYAETLDVKISTSSPSASIKIQGSPALISTFSMVSSYTSISYENSVETESSGLFILSATTTTWESTPNPEPILVVLESSITGQRLSIVAAFDEAAQGSCPVESKKGSVDILSNLLSILSRYQGTLFLIVCLLISLVCVIISYNIILNPGYKQTGNTEVFANNPRSLLNYFSPPASPVAPFKTSPPQPKHTPSPVSQPLKYELWSVDEEPVYGDPVFRSSPRPAYEGSPTYSRRPNYS